MRLSYAVYAQPLYLIASRRHRLIDAATGQPSTAPGPQRERSIFIVARRYIVAAADELLTG